MKAMSAESQNAGYRRSSTQDGRRMRAAVLNKIPGKLEIEEIRTTPLQPREVLVKVVGSGLCHSDLHFMEGKLIVAPPAVLGHEAAGVVEEVGSEVTLVKP